MSAATQVTRSPLAVARECRERAEAMTGDELDAWYEEHVGYRPSVDDPFIRPAQHAEMVASSMFFHVMPGGLKTAEAKAMQRLLERAILTGAPL